VIAISEIRTFLSIYRTAAAEELVRAVKNNKNPISFRNLPFLKGQIGGIIEVYTDALRCTDSSIPWELRNLLNDRLDAFENEGTATLFSYLTTYAAQHQSSEQLAAHLSDLFTAHAAQLDDDLERGYEKIANYRLSGADGADIGKPFLFISEHSDSTCSTCGALGGKVFTLGQLLERDLVPPLHPNCRCRITAVLDSGSPPQKQLSEPVSTKELLSLTRNFFAPSADWLRDAYALFWDIVSGTADKYANEFEYLSDRLGKPLGGALTLLDWLSLGIVSELFERSSAMMEDPSFFNIANWITMGLAESVRGTVDPNEPLSPEHWLSSLALAAAVYGGYEFASAVRAAHGMPVVYGESILWKEAEFSNRKRFEDHIKDHSREFGNITSEEYLKRAQNLMSALPSDDVLQFTSSQGWYFKYRISTNEFALGHPNITISTYFLPEKGIIYWQDQVSKYKK